MAPVAIIAIDPTRRLLDLNSAVRELILVPAADDPSVELHAAIASWIPK